MRSWLIGAAGPWSVASAWRSARDRALERFGERRGIEVAQHRARVVAGAAHEPGLARDVDEEPFGRARHRVERKLPAPCAKLRHRPVELRRRHVAGVELVDAAARSGIPARRVHCVAFGPAPCSTARHAIDAELASRAGRCDAGPSTSRESSARSGTRAASRRCRSNAAAARRAAAAAASSADCSSAQRLLERRLVRVHEALRQVVDRLPDALGELGRACRSSRRTA